MSKWCVGKLCVSRWREEEEDEEEEAGGSTQPKTRTAHKDGE